MQIVLSFFFFTASLFASELDDRLNVYIGQFRYKAIEPLRNNESLKYRLGKKLFFDKRLSLNNTISCSTCHDPKFNSADALPFSYCGSQRTHSSSRLD